MGKPVIVQKGSGKDLFAYFHIEPSYIRDQAKAATTDTVVAELWGLGTSSYKTALASYGGWKKYVAMIAKEAGTPAFQRTCLTTWSAGSQMIKSVCRAAEADQPDAIVSLDGIYGTKPPGSRAGDGAILWDPEFEGIGRYALRAARGECIFVLLHSQIATPYGSSGEAADAIRAFVEREMGEEMHWDACLSPDDLDKHQFREAYVLGNFHLVAFPGIDAKEHVREAHLFDEVWKKFIPWATDDRATDPAPPMGESEEDATESEPPVVAVDARGPEVKRWQTFLRGQGASIVADGVFGPKTHEATKAFQRSHGAPATGALDVPTLRAAEAIGYGMTHPSDWPPRPDFLPITGLDVDRAFGKLEFVAAPTPGNPEGIRITNDFDRNIVSVSIPQIATLVGGPKDGRAYFHKAAADRARELFSRWDRAGLSGQLLSWAGSWVPRFVRGSRTTLSNHSRGTAFDINAPWNALGAVPAAAGTKGSVRELVEIAAELGWWWGGWGWPVTSGPAAGTFDPSRRLDGMHFELARL